MTAAALVIATHNAGKVREFAALVAPLGLTVLSATDLNLPEPDETGSTFHENAAIKALAAASASGKPSLADDSGMAVTLLDGAPGIYSARWAGPEKDFAYAMQRVESELTLKSTTPTGAEAFFICVLCLALPDGSTYFFEGKLRGSLTFPPRGTEGFGYDPIFMPQGETRSFGEIPPAEKQCISHRAIAFAQLKDFLQTPANHHLLQKNNGCCS